MYGFILLTMNQFTFDRQNEVVTPQLVIDRDQLEKNIDHALKIAGSAKRLWPHVKTHKSGEITSLLIRKGITKFKCATIAECEMVAERGAEKALLAYPVVGPNISRLLDIQEAFPATEFSGIFDDFAQLQEMSRQCVERNTKCRILLDVNVGLSRTGIPLESVPSFYKKAEKLKNILVMGLHC